MVKTTPDSAGTVNVMQGTSATWVATNAATTNVGFTNDSWTGFLTRTGNNNARTGTLEIGVWNGTFTPKGSGTADFANKAMTTGNVAIAINSPPFDIAIGQYLALGYSNTEGGGGNKSVDVSTTSGSWVQSPSTDPGYPVPDVETWIFFAAGLAIIGVVFWRLRRKQSPFQPAEDL